MDQGLRIYRSLADALQADEFRTNEYVLIDCAPNFTMVTSYFDLKK